MADKKTTPGKLESTETATGTVSSSALLSVPVERYRDLYRAHFTVSGEVVGLSVSVADVVCIPLPVHTCNLNQGLLGTY